MVTLGRVATTVFCAALAATLALAQEGAKPKAKDAPATKPAAASASVKAPEFVIVRMGDKLEVMNKTSVEAKNKDFAADYDKALQQFEKEKAANKKFDGAKPQKKTVEVLPGEFTTPETAAAALKKMEEELKAKQAKEKEKDKAKDGGEKPKAAGDAPKKSGGGH